MYYEIELRIHKKKKTTLLRRQAKKLYFHSAVLLRQTVKSVVTWD